MSHACLRHLLPALCLCGLGSGRLPAQDAAKTVVLRPAQQFLRPRPPLGTAPRCSLLEAPADQPRNLTGANQDDAEGLDLEALLSMLHRAERDAGRLNWEIGNAGMLLSGDANLVGNCDKELDRLAAAFTRPIAVTAWLLPETGEPLPSVLDPAALAALHKDGKPLWTQTTRTQPFGQVTLGNERWTRYVRDVDVEVAQKAQIGDPKVDVMLDGIRLSCTVEPLPDGDQLVLDVNLAYGEKVAMLTVSTGVKDQPDIELPQVRTALAQASARIQNGGALVLQLRSAAGAGPSCRVLLSARFLAPPAAPVGGALLFVPIGALLHQAPAVSIASLPKTPESDVHHPDFLPTPASVFAAEDLGQFLQHSAGDGLDFSVQAGFLVLQGDPSQQDRVMVALRRLADLRLQNIELLVETRGAVADATDAGALMPSTKAPYAPLWRLLLPTLSCRPGAGFVGTEFQSISDFEVEIAQKAAVNNPVPTVYQSGLWSAVRLQPQGTGVYADWLSLVASQGPPRLHPLGGVPDGQLGLVDSHLAAFPLQGELEAGQDIDLGDGPVVLVGEQQLRTRQFVRVSRR